MLFAAGQRWYAKAYEALGLTPANQGYLLLVFAGCWLGGVFDGLDSALMHVTMPLALAELTGQPAQAVAHWGGLITAVFLLGWTLGGLLLGYVGDRFGRVKAMLISIVVYSLFTGLGGLAQTPLQLACFRFLTGIGIGGELVSITAFLSEVWPPKSKGLATALLITSYQVGQLLAGALNYWIHDWRYAFFVGALPALLTFALRRNLKESDAWLVTHHALQARHGGVLSATVWLRQWLGTLFASENTRNLWVGSVAFGAYLTVTWASMAWIPSANYGARGVCLGGVWRGGLPYLGVGGQTGHYSGNLGHFRGLSGLVPWLQPIPCQPLCRGGGVWLFSRPHPIQFLRLRAFAVSHVHSHGGHGVLF